jgi:ribonuclease VapC
MTDCIVDASAVMARLKNERGAEIVEARAPAALISAVNHAEVVGKLIDLGVPADAVVAALAELGMAVVAFDETAATRTGMLRAATRRLGLSLGDRACLALAEATGLPVLTADRAWAELDLGVEVVLIR